MKQAHLVAWEDIKDNSPHELKISPIAAIPHKLKAFQLILDLSFQLWANGGILAAVNDTMEKSAPKGAIDQIRECLLCIIYVFAKADGNAKIFYNEMGHKEWFLANGLQGGPGMEFFICPFTTQQVPNYDCCSHVPPDGLGQITTIFLCCN